MNNIQVLLKNNFVNINHGIVNPLNIQALSANIATLVSNLSYYGYIPSLELLEKFQSLSEKELVSFWKSFEIDLKFITGADKEMEKFVVYKNFPKEVLDKTESEYWIAQILMYWGLPNEIFTKEEKNRPKLSEKTSLKVLSLAKENTLQEIFNQLILSPARWTDNQKEMVLHLFSQVEDKSINVDVAKFKENIIQLAQEAMKSLPVEQYASIITISNATDVLRLASAMSEGDVSLRSNVKFKNFKRSERRFLLSLLDNCNNLMEDVAARSGIFKKLLKALHPGDYTFNNVIEVYNKLYNGEYDTFQSLVVEKTQNKKVEALEMLKSRPGEFLRNFHHMYKVYGKKAVKSFIEIVPSLTNMQLLKMSKYLETINDRKKLIFAPKGNWANVKIEDNKKIPFADNDKIAVLNAINNEMIHRLEIQVPNGVNLDEKTKQIKLQTNDQELASYGRGTAFDIPENMKFIRSASYWAIQSENYIWFDNSWNFFDENWQSKSTCCWSSPKTENGGAVFSGDPTNTKDIEGRACQMIDLYLDKLQEEGIRYAVWNVLSYSKIPFGDADVLATLQYGENPEEGKLYEPSRAQMVFPLKGANLSKYIAYIDVEQRRLIYIDANFYGNVQSADRNGTILETVMPACVEYLDSLPSVYDLFKNAQTGDTPIMYSDKDVLIKSEKAFVFRKENPNNKFDDYQFNELLSEKHQEKEKKKKKKI